MHELILKAIGKGAKLYASISGGKDGEAMVETMIKNNLSIAGLVHADLGRVEWPESMPQCIKLTEKFGLPLHVVKRKDGLDMLAYWQKRMRALSFQACDVVTRQEIIVHSAPFWSSKSNRYCTSDLKRDPINVFFTSTGENFIISCEGIRAEESTDRAAKEPVSIRWRKTSTYYKGMTVEEAIANYNPKKKLVLDWYPIFNFSIEEVWQTKGLSSFDLERARDVYKKHLYVPDWWTFHPAYAYGNSRVSCIFCIMGCLSDLQTGAIHHPGLLDEMIQMQIEGEATFKSGWSLAVLLPKIAV